MKSFKTVNEAVEYAEGKDDIGYVLEIEPGLPGIEKYVCSKCDLASFGKTLVLQPIQEIKYAKGVAIDLNAARELSAVEEKYKKILGLRIFEATIAKWTEHYDKIQELTMVGSSSMKTFALVEPAVTVGEIENKFPTASVYKKSEHWGKSANSFQKSLGKEAMRLLRFGVDYQVVSDQMDCAWSAYCAKSILEIILEQ